MNFLQLPDEILIATFNTGTEFEKCKQLSKNHRKRLNEIEAKFYKSKYYQLLQERMNKKWPLV